MADIAEPLRALIGSERVTPATREALLQRLDRPVIHGGRFFEADAWATLVAACARLLPPSSPVSAEVAASAIDDRLSSGEGPGWRYDTLPADGIAYRLGLAHVERQAQARGQRFAALEPGDQDALLKEVARAPSASAFDSRRWFEMLLVDVTEAHVAHPAAQVAMGHFGFADAGGWQHVGLGEREPWEPDRAMTEPPAAAAPPVVAVPSKAASGPVASAPVVRFSESDVVDAVVIGTGAGGGPLLWRLARSGARVVALEAGAHWQPGRDFATDEKAQAKLFWTDERLSAGRDPLGFGSNNSGIGVGGSTLHYTAYTPRPHPDDLRLFSDFGVGRDWPLSYDELAPYFDEVEALLGVSGPTPYPWGPTRRRGYPLPPLPLNAAAELMQRGCATLGLATSPAANAALSRDYAVPGMAPRRACTNRGYCQAGCTTGAKSSVDVVFIPPALAAGAELRTGCFARWIERDSQGRVSGVVYLQDGKERRQKCRNVFLCAGSVETPRFLLFNEGLSNGSGQVGRNFMAHVGKQLWARFDESTKPWKGIPGGLISEDMHRPRGESVDFAGGYLLQSIGVMPLTYATQLARSGRGLFGAELEAQLSRYDHVAGINVLGDCLPSPGNFLELSDERDARGLPKPRVHFSAGPNEQRMSAHAERTMRSIWQAAGAREPWVFDRYAHVIGTCRMGEHDGDAVVDRDGRSFEVPGLHIADNAIFPSALSVNPALTIMALSLRIADRFIARQRGLLL